MGGKLDEWRGSALRLRQDSAGYQGDSTSAPSAIWPEAGARPHGCDPVRRECSSAHRNVVLARGAEDEHVQSFIRYRSQVDIKVDATYAYGDRAALEKGRPVCC